MLSKFALSLLAPIAVTAFASTATAATMTLNSGVGSGNVYVEDGITATGNENSFVGLYGNGSIHFDDGGTSAPSRVVFTMDTPFDAISFDLRPIGSSFFTCDLIYGGCNPLAFENVQVQGYRGLQIVSSLLFDMTSSTSAYQVLLGPFFTNLTSLAVEVVLPPLGLANTMCMDSPCSHFEIDNVVLNPVAAVPLPASLPIAATGLALLGLLRRRKQRRT